MMRNKKRAISNFFILLVLVAGISWVCGKFIHLGNVEYTDNAQVKQHLTQSAHGCKASSRKSALRNTRQ